MTMGGQIIFPILIHLICLHLTGSQLGEKDIHVRTMGICSGAFEEVTEGSELYQSMESGSLSSVGQKRLLWPFFNQSLPEQSVLCSLELTACAKCQIRISWDTDKATQTLDPTEETALFEPSAHLCGRALRMETCSDIVLEEDPAEEIPSQHAIPYRSFSILEGLSVGNFTSSAFKLLVKFHISRSTEDMRQFLRSLFPLKLDVIDNTFIGRGRPADSGLESLATSYGFVSSPRYPLPYPDGVWVNYTLINDAGGPVRLVFEDFNVHYMSSLKILDSDGRELLNTMSKFSGKTDGRPRPTQSSGDQLTILFAGNHFTKEIGFRAKYTFVQSSYWPQMPQLHNSQGCDETFLGFGGSLSIPGKNLDVNSYVDCVWIIGKQKYTAPVFNRLYVKVEDFSVESDANGIQLEIRDGRTSISRKILDIWGPKSRQELAGIQPQEGFVTKLKDEDEEPRGFYIRLRGYLNSYSGLTISFAQFYKWANAMCHDRSEEFHCDNSRCIKSKFLCDQFDHCGDFTDEKGEGCKKAGGALGGSQGGDRGPPSTGHVGKFPLGSYTTTILLVAGLIGLTLVMLMVTVIVARVYRQRLIRRLTQEANAVVSDSHHHNGSGRDETPGARSGASIQRHGDRRFYVLPDSDVQMFEAPPAYDDALKHPSVPPRPTHGFDNPGFATDSAEAGPSIGRPAVHAHNEAELAASDTESSSSSSASEVDYPNDVFMDPVASCSDTECHSIDSQPHQTPGQPEDHSNRVPHGTLTGIWQWARTKVVGGGRGQRPTPEGEADVVSEKSNSDDELEQISIPNETGEVVGDSKLPEEETPSAETVAGTEPEVYVESRV